jgi:hypothetical protein
MCTANPVDSYGFTVTRSLGSLLRFLLRYTLTLLVRMHGVDGMMRLSSPSFFFSWVLAFVPCWRKRATCIVLNWGSYVVTNT